ncbi:hypothetical protein ACWCXB_16930 [Streptomyces sp. NPDC001514]
MSTPLVAAEAALHAVIEAVTGTGRPGARARAAIAGSYADLWACRRLAYAAADSAAAAAVARYLAPRLLLDGADGLAAALGAQLHAPDGPAAHYRHQVRRLEAAVAAPGAAGRTREVAARLPALAGGDDRLARPLTAVPSQALARPLNSLVRGLEDARAAVVHATQVPGDGGPGVWALADRYALLTVAAACLDGWRAAGSSRSRVSGDRICLVAALDRLAVGLGVRAAGPLGAERRDEVYELAAAGARIPSALSAAPR